MNPPLRNDRGVAASDPEPRMSRGVHARHARACGRTRLLRALLGSCLALVSVAGDATEYSSGWDQGWRHVHEHGHAYGNCWLALDVPGYGQARFVKDAQGALAFEFQARHDLQRGDVQVVTQAPDWHPAYPARGSVDAALHLQGGGVVVRGAPARQLFVALRDGHELWLRGAQDTPARAPLDVHLRALHAGTAMQAFMACMEPAFDVNWRALSRTRVTYAVDEHELSAADEQTLSGIAAYIAADAAVAHVYVDGHTDSSGTERGNYQLSKRRAEGVAQALRAFGVPGAKLRVRYHGAKYPVADNALEDGKARNRRTTVRLERQDEMARR